MLGGRQGTVIAAQDRSRMSTGAALPCSVVRPSPRVLGLQIPQLVGLFDFFVNE